MTIKSKSRTNRTKSQTLLIPIPNAKHADDILARMAELSGQIEKAKFDAAEEINITKDRLADTVDDLNETLDRYHKSLESFAVNNKDIFGKARSKKLNHGTIGWRSSTVMKISNATKKNPTGTLELLKQHFKTKFKQFVKIKETVDKNALKRLTDEQLALVKARREDREVFFVEPDVPEAVKR